MNANVKMNFNNKYHIELINSITGEVKQSGDFHNTVCIGMLATFVCHGDMTTAEKSPNQYPRAGRIFGSLDVGSGTTVPSFNDTALASLLWNTNPDDDSRTFEWIDDYTGKGAATFTFPATAAYVGTVTEIGLKSAYSPNSYSSSYNYRLCTRALLTDSEGQQISFEKTDIDILKIAVTVELTVTSSSNAFKVFKHPYFIYYAFHGSGTAFASAHGLPGFSRFYGDMRDPHGAKYTSLNERPTDSAGTAAYMYSSAETYYKYTKYRLLATTITNERYYKGIVVPGIGYWELPNEEVFPTYTITAVPIGAGDGTTTSFENPLCYFKKDTEKVYKNGVQLTRGTDYTINNKGNAKCLPEVAELIPPKKVTSGAVLPFAFAFASLFRPSCYNKTPSQIDSTKEVLCFSADNPIYLEYEDAVTFNCLKSNGGWRIPSSSGETSYLPKGVVFYLDYSTDGQEYTEIGSVATTFRGSTTETDTAFALDFADVTAKYWRLRTSHVAPIGIHAEGYYVTLNRKDPYIVFTTPPAEGDVLTMDVGMDLIMKNSNFVIDVDVQLNFSV